MNLSDLHLKKAYSSETDDILHDFYIPALQASIAYDRLAGFFTSRSLAIAARGILGLISNGGSMRLVVSPRLEQEDLEAIEISYKDPARFIEKKMLGEINWLEDGYVRDHIYALGWLIANAKLRLKVAVPCGRDGKPMSGEEVHRIGLFHQKVGVLRGRDGQVIAFSGSINETAAGWLQNVEEFKVFRSWLPLEHEYVKTDIAKFDRFWNGLAKHVEVMDIAAAIERRLVEIVPRDFDPSNLQQYYRESQASSRIRLHSHQIEAVQSWFNNDRKGIFQMATGTGKTFAALGCLDRLSRTHRELVVVIACPYQHLLQQWRREIEKFGVEYDRLIVADSSNPSWKDVLTDSMIDVDLHYSNMVIVLTTHASFSSDDLARIIRRNKGQFSVLLVADEVHGLGANKSREGLIDEYDLRLGLSATPRRWFDAVGTEVLYDFFGGLVYEFGLEKAINTINPSTGQTYLTPYRYLPVFIPLTDEELEKYVRKSRAIASRFGRARNDEEKEELLELLLFQRANIVKDAELKYQALHSVLDELVPLKWTLIYCSPRQIDQVMEIMNQRRVIAHRFTAIEGTEPDNRYGGLSEREFLLDKFAEGRYQVLVAMKCLDEGVDVPPARTAILMASSGNPREYIQRIGRVIRRFPKKEEATLYDLIVVPGFGRISTGLADMEWRIFQKELERYEEIAMTAVNNAGALRLVYDIKEGFREVMYE